MGGMNRLPNALSLSRVVLAALFIPAGPGARLARIGLAGATDFLDGWIARRTHTVTRGGALVDPIADRLFVLVAVVASVLDGGLSVAQSLILLSRDVATALGFVIARAVPRLRAQEFKARRLGKIVTVLQLFTLVAVVLRARLVTPLIVAVGVASVAAVVDYTHAVSRADSGRTE